MLLGAGSSSRFGLKAKKQWLFTGELPLWLYVAKRFEKMQKFHKIIITSSKREKPLFEKYCDYLIIEGGQSRQASVKNALKEVQTPYLLVSDIARVCVNGDMVRRILDKKEAADCVVPYISPPDTVVYQNETIERSEVKLIQTPQLCRTDTLKKALQSQREFTDESSAIRAIGAKVEYVEGDKRAMKLTYKEDLRFLDCIEKPSKTELVGEGFDVHPFDENRELFLGGVKIEHSRGLAGHSDADVVIHALIDALLGAANFGDIGELFPDSSDRYKGIDSKELLKEVKELLQECGFEPVKVDITIMAQEPRLYPYKLQMATKIGSILNLEKHRVNIKATTTEGLGFIGRAEGIAAKAVATLKYYNWSEDESIDSRE